MLCDINKYFNNDDNACTNKQLIGCKDLFRVVILKEWVVSNQKRIYFKSHDREIVKTCIKYYHECWKRR